MKVAVFSDIHENSHNLVLALEEFQKLKVEKILFLWDFVSPLVAQILTSSPIPVFAIWGNNDGDKVSIVRKSLTSWSNLEIWIDVFDTIVLDWRNIFLTHYPLLAKPMAKSWDFDAVFYGHDHKHNMDKINDCICFACFLFRLSTSVSCWLTNCWYASSSGVSDDSADPIYVIYIFIIFYLE